MPILNIDQFIEREETRLPICPKCSGKMIETPVNSYDALKLLFKRKKIIRRYKCDDCSSEKTIEK